MNSIFAWKHSCYSHQSENMHENVFEKGLVKRKTSFTLMKYLKTVQKFTKELTTSVKIWIYLPHVLHFFTTYSKSTLLFYYLVNVLVCRYLKSVFSIVNWKCFRWINMFIASMLFYMSKTCLLFYLMTEK